MRRRKLLYGLGASGAVLVPSGLTAAAYNSFTVEREANIQVRADSSGDALLGLAAGNSDIVTEDSDGALLVDIAEAATSADGVNVDSTLIVGNTNDLGVTPTSAAFSVTNNDDVSRDFDISYTEDSADSASGTDNIKYRLYDSGGTELSNSPVSENTAQTVSIGSTATINAIIEVNTDALDASNDDLSGTLTFSTSPSP